MGATRAFGVVLACVVYGGCVAEPRADDEELGDVQDAAPNDSMPAMVESRAAAGPRDDRASHGCDGAAPPSCEGPFTGAACDLPCIGGVDPSACGLARTCHSDGSTYGLTTRNAVLHPASPEDPDAVVEADFEQWVVEHPADLGLPAGLSIDDVELHRLADFRSTAGPLTIFRFTQTYHGVPVLAPDGIVTLVYGPHGAVATTGAIIDGRASYDHGKVQATADHAVRSMLEYASAYERVPVDELEVIHATPVAIPMRQAIGWAGLVRREGGAMLARVVVDADPSFALASTGDLTALAYANQTTLTTGAPLLGSVDDASQEIQLATERPDHLHARREPVRHARPRHHRGDDDARRVVDDGDRARGQHRHRSRSRGLELGWMRLSSPGFEQRLEHPRPPGTARREAP